MHILSSCVTNSLFDQLKVLESFDDKTLIPGTWDATGINRLDLNIGVV